MKVTLTANYIKLTGSVIFFLTALIAFSSYLAPIFSSKAPNTIRLVANDACPYSCRDGQSQGFAVDYLAHLLSTEGISLEVVYLHPSWVEWAVRFGNVDGFLGAPRYTVRSCCQPQVTWA